MKRVWSLILAVAMIISMLPATAITALADTALESASLSSGTDIGSPSDVTSPTDVTSRLLDVTSGIWQEGPDGQRIDLEQGEALNPALKVKVNMNMRVPVEGDDLPEDQIVRWGDTASFQLSDQFSLLGNTTQELRTADGMLVGHVNFRSAGGKVFADIIFDGEEEIFAFDEDGGQPIGNVTTGFEITLQYAGNLDDLEDGDLITILDKDFVIQKPVEELINTIKKTGAVHTDPGTNTPVFGEEWVEWSVEITAKKGEVHQSLEGYLFEDNLTGVGELIPGSFRVVASGTDLTPPVIVEEDGVLRYTFPQDAGSPAAITFRTRIPQAQLTQSGQQSITNKAELTAGEETLDDSYPVTFKPRSWIKKSGVASQDTGTVYDPQNNTITWTIEVNPDGRTLSNAVITDLLDSGLIWQSAYWETKNAGAWGNPTTVPTQPAGGKYELGNIHTPVRLTIVTKPKVNDTGIVDREVTYNNTAAFSWGDGSQGSYSGSHGVGIGYPSFTKSSPGVDRSTGVVTWKVGVDLRHQATSTDLKVYDLLVHGTSKLTTTKPGVWPEEIPEAVRTSLLGGGQALNQQYVPGSFDKGVYAGLELTRYVIEDADGKPLADLLVVSGLSNQVSQNYTFKSQLTNLGRLIQNNSTPLDNYAQLFSGTRYLSTKSASQSIPRRAIDKELLHRDEVPKADGAINANNRTTTSGNGYNHQLNQVIFRLNVNGNGLDFDGLGLGQAIVTDTLPKGWDFANFEGGKPYLIYRAAPLTSGNTTYLVAGDPVTLTDEQLAVTPDVTGDGRKTLTFQFADMTEPYVILVKAAPTAATLEGYLVSDNTTFSESNNAKLSTTTWTTGVSDSQSVTGKTEILSKSNLGQTDGQVSWGINYLPMGRDLGDRLEDTLSSGIDLRTDAGGQLLVEGNIWLWELEQKADGSWEKGEPVVLTLGTNISYAPHSRTLTVKLPDSTRAYRLEYITDITGDNAKVSNTVKLWKNSEVVVEREDVYEVQHNDGWASLEYFGWVQITKKDGQEDHPLPGVEFTLFAQDGVTPIRSGVTNGNGQVRFLALPQGRYVIKETKSLDDYSPSDAQYLVIVTKLPDSKMATVVEAPQGLLSNRVEVLNYRQDAQVGSLTLTKEVTGEGGDRDKKFEFVITFTPGEDQELPGEFLYTGEGGAAPGILENGGSVWLSHGQKIRFEGLPYGTRFRIVEVEANQDNYTTQTTGSVGVIHEEQPVWNAVYTNTYQEPLVGSLTLAKTVAGEGGDYNKKFEFVITFTPGEGQELPGEFSYTGEGGAAPGTLENGGSVWLSHGQKIRFQGLPDGTRYTVTEVEANQDGYNTTAIDAAGTVNGEKADWDAVYVNTHRQAKVGSLTLAKQVEGRGGDRTRKFTFRVVLRDASGEELTGEFPYTGVSGDAPSGTIRSGGTVQLSHGQKILIGELPYGTRYTVTEAEANQGGYTTAATAATGTISDSRAAWDAVYTNTYDRPDEPDDPDDDDDDDDDGGGNTPPGTIIIIDGEVPLGALPRTGRTPGATLGGAGLLAIFLGGALTVTHKKRREHDQDQDDDQ